MAFVAQRRRAANHVLRHGQCAVRADADGMVPQFARYWKEQTGQYPPAPAVRFAGHHLCGLEPLERGPRRLHHHSAAWVEHACTGETSAGRILAAMPNHPGRAGKRRQVRYVDERLVNLDDYQVLPCVNSSSPAWGMSPRPSSRPMTALNGRRRGRHPDLRQSESRR